MGAYLLCGCPIGSHGKRGARGGRRVFDASAVFVCTTGRFA